MAGLSRWSRKNHHDLSQSVQDHHQMNIEKLTDVLVSGDSNPFCIDGDDLVNLVTKVVIPQDIKNDILRSDEKIGMKAYEDFVSERIVGTKSLWDKMTKLKLKTCKSTGKNAK